VFRRAFVVFFPLLLAGQTAFEAASIRQNKSAEPRSEFKISPNGVTITNYRLQFLIANIYGIPVYSISGAPDWLSSNKYDIVARAPEGTSEAQIKLMLRQLLVDRFKLKFHQEQKDVSGYALVIAKGGLKVQVEKHDKPAGDDGRVLGARASAWAHDLERVVSPGPFALPR
jgi:uncharacterized protein (TIGR03435 family)